MFASVTLAVSSHLVFHIYIFILKTIAKYFGEKTRSEKREWQFRASLLTQRNKEETLTSLLPEGFQAK